MFVFDRSIWTVAAGLATALALVLTVSLLDRLPPRPASPEAPPALQTPAVSRPAGAPESHDISLAKR